MMKQISRISNYLLILGILLIYSISCYSQENFNSAYHYQLKGQPVWGSVGLSLGGQFPGYTAVDKMLESLGYGNTPAGLIGGGVWFEYGKGKILCEMGCVFATSNQDKAFENVNSVLSVKGGRGVFSLGYKFDLKHGFFFYPKVGITGGTNDFVFTTERAFSTSFITVIDKVRMQQSVSNYYLSQTIGGEFLFPMGNLAHIGIDFMFGLPPFNDQWDYNDIPLSDTPKSNPALFSLNVKYIFYINQNHIAR